MQPKPSAGGAPAPLRCPRCNNTDVVPSLPRRLWDEIMRGFGRTPRQCRSCGKRFYVFESVYVADRE